MLKKIPFLLLLQARCFSTKFTLKELAGQLRDNYKNVVVMVGAGLSTPSGIPDFRSPDSGVYNNLQKYNLPRPEAMFDIHYFQKNPLPFFDLARELYPGRYKPNLAHYFIYLLQQKGKLLRLYTQNIDGLERLAGIKEDILVEAHGTFSTASCIKCKKKYDPDEVKRDIFNNSITICDHCQGIVKPDIVFFGEELPKRFDDCADSDTKKTDLLIVMGTSLEVYPFAWLADVLPFNTPRLLLNREEVGSFGISISPYTADVVIKNDIIDGVKLLAKEVGWWDELKLLTDEKTNINVPD